MIDPHTDAQEFLARCIKVHSLPASNPQRTADIILLFGEMIPKFQGHIEYQKGYQRVHQRFISRVHELLGTISVASNGRANWQTELPTGTAPHFRRALNRLISLVLGDED